MYIDWDVDCEEFEHYSSTSSIKTNCNMVQEVVYTVDRTSYLCRRKSCN
jgi:hypothetical protein